MQPTRRVLIRALSELRTQKLAKEPTHAEKFAVHCFMENELIRIYRAENLAKTLCSLSDLLAMNCVKLQLFIR